MRTRHFYFVGLLFLIASVVLASCSSGGGSGGTTGGGGGGGGGGGTTIPVPSLVMLGTSGNAVNMNGTWDGGCSYDSVNQENERDILTLNGGSATVVSSTWSAATITNCTQTGAPDILINITVTASLDPVPTSTAIWVDANGTLAGPPAGISAPVQATKATIVYNSATMTPGSDAYVNDFNTPPGLCNQTDWAKGVPKNVLNCADIIQSTTETDYWVVDDSAAQLKWYSSSTGTAWQVDNSNPMVK